MSNKITVLGSSNTDMVIKSPRLPAPGETVLGGRFLTNPGGKGANQCVAVARMGGDVSFVAKVGNDALGQQAIELFKSEGINTAFIAIDHEDPSGAALIMVDDSGENCISVALGANEKLGLDDVDIAKGQIESSGIILMQLETPVETVTYAAEMAHAAGTKVVLNPAPAQILEDGLLKNIFLITPNETEAELLTGVAVKDESSAVQAAQILKQRGVKNVIITMGAAGAFLSLEDGSTSLVPATRVDVVDTTAAGDTFNGALVVALSEGFPIAEAAAFANKVAAVSVTKMGAQASIPYRNQFN